MKVKLSNFLDETFIASLRYFSRLHIPIAVSYMLEKCLTVIQEEYTRYHKTKDELLVKYGKIENEKGELIAVDIYKAKPENQKIFFDEFNSFIELEFDIPLEEKMVVNVSKIKDADISVEYLNKLKLLIDFKE